MSETATIPVPETAALAPSIPSAELPSAPAPLASPYITVPSAVSRSAIEVCAADPYAGISMSPFTQQASEILLARLSDDEIEVLPTGELYLPEILYRRRLAAAFGPGGWAMRPLSRISATEKTVNGQTKVIIVQEWGLYVGGRFISSAHGEGDYWQSNDNATEATAVESAKSIALRRVCKDIGIASELWDRRFANRWQDEHCVRVWVSGGKKPCWRRKDAKPFWNETGIVQERETKPASAVPATIDAGHVQADAPQTVDATSAPAPKERCPSCGKMQSIGPNRYPYSRDGVSYEGGRACYKKSGGCGKQFGGTAVGHEPPPEPAVREPGDDLPF